MLHAEAVDCTFDLRLLPLGKGHNAQRPVRVPPDMVFQQFHAFLGLFDIAVLAAALVDTVRNQDIFQSLVCFGCAAREGGQPVFVQVAVGKGDQGLVPAPVVPEQGALGEAGCLVQQGIADHVRIVVFLLIPGLVVGQISARRGEKCGGRQLLAVTRDNGLISPVDGAYRVFRQDLGGLIKDDHIKIVPVRIQEIGYGQGRHHKAGLEPSEQTGNGLEKTSKRHDPALFARFFAEDRDLVHGPCHLTEARGLLAGQLLGQTGPDDILGDIGIRLKLFNGMFMRPGIELIELIQLIAGDGVHRPLGQKCLLIGGDIMVIAEPGF